MPANSELKRAVAVLKEADKKASGRHDIDIEALITKGGPLISQMVEASGRFAGLMSTDATEVTADDVLAWMFMVALGEV
jgi:hypothetical protein